MTNTPRKVIKFLTAMLLVCLLFLTCACTRFAQPESGEPAEEVAQAPSGQPGDNGEPIADPEPPEEEAPQPPIGPEETEKPAEESETPEELPEDAFQDCEIAFDGVTFGGAGVWTVEELWGKYGEPDQVMLHEGVGRISYIYGGLEYISFTADDGRELLAGVLTKERTEAAFPRDIRVGDTFEDVFAKFPHAKDYETDKYNSFYGKSTLEGAAGGVFKDGDGNKALIVVAPCRSYIRVDFDESDRAVSIYLGTPLE